MSVTISPSLKSNLFCGPATDCRVAIAVEVGTATLVATGVRVFVAVGLGVIVGVGSTIVAVAVAFGGADAVKRARTVAAT
jgi:hypothetical protein